MTGGPPPQAQIPVPQQQGGQRPIVFDDWDMINLTPEKVGNLFETVRKLRAQPYEDALRQAQTAHLGEEIEMSKYMRGKYKPEELGIHQRNAAVAERHVATQEAMVPIHQSELDLKNRIFALDQQEKTEMNPVKKVHLQQETELLKRKQQAVDNLNNVTIDLPGVGKVGFGSLEMLSPGAGAAVIKASVGGMSDGDAATVGHHIQWANHLMSDYKHAFVDPSTGQWRMSEGWEGLTADLKSEDPARRKHAEEVKKAVEQSRSAAQQLIDQGLKRARKAGTYRPTQEGSSPGSNKPPEYEYVEGSDGNRYRREKGKYSQPREGWELVK